MATKVSDEINKTVMDRYRERTRQSMEYDAQAKKHLPGGDTRAVTYYMPYPAYMVTGKGCRLYDCDGNEYIDFINNFTSLIHGHAHPDIVAAASEQLSKGTVLGSPAVVQSEHARLLCERIPGMDQVRYCNSGTEATLHVIRAARAFAGKDVIVKMDGGYHGSHDAAEVNITPDLWSSTGLPTTHLDAQGVPASVLGDIMVVPFNDLEAAETVLKENKDRIAAIIMEPMLGSLGMVPPQPGYLEGMRELADKYEVLLIFDEVITFRLCTGGLQALYDVNPDLTALGKLIGGGFPVGAFGGRKDIMARFDPAHPQTMMHSGTFNGNNITMAAGVAALRAYDHNAVDTVNKLGDKLRNGFNEVFKKVSIKGQATGMGSLVHVHWTDEDITNAKDYAMGLISAAELPKLLHLEMMNRGIFSAFRGMFCTSTPMTDAEVDKAIESFQNTLELLKPYAAEAAPHLV
jgi:glutamate-1-semialdehyde 2,1-aminomutase